MIAFCVLFSFGVAYIAYRGVAGTTGVNIAINIVQIAALLVFSVIAVGYRLNHNTKARRLHGRPGQQPDPGRPQERRRRQTAEGRDGPTWWNRKTGPTSRIRWSSGQGHHPGGRGQGSPRAGKTDTAQFHESAISVIVPHGFSYVIVQACIAILILVGFESVTSMGEEAKNAKRDIPRAVLLSLLIQGVVCYLIEYFSASYFLNPGATR